MSLRFYFCMRFWIKYCIGTALLVGLHILWMSYMAAQHSALLRSGRRTERIYVYKLERVYGLYILHIESCW